MPHCFNLFKHIYYILNVYTCLQKLLKLRNFLIYTGYDNLVKSGVLSPYKEYRDFYDENVLPQVSLEFPYILRWAHTIQEGKLK